jgi:hypothetical protein
MGADCDYRSIDIQVQWSSVSLITTGGYKNYFLTIECDYEGITSKAVASSAVPTRGLFSLEPPSDSAPTSTGFLDPNTHQFQPSHPKTPSTRMYNPKRQYRLVYKELCSALHHLDSLETILSVLSDALIGMLGLVFHARRN